MDSRDDQLDTKQSTQNRILLIHPHALVREGIISMLENTEFDVAAQAGNADITDTLISGADPDIILIDWELSEVNRELVQALAEHSRGSVVILTRPQAANGVLPAITAGAKGYLSLDATPAEFLQSLRTLCMGSVVLSSDMAESLQHNLSAEQTSHRDDLSDREREVLELLVKGASNSEIADELIVSEHTIKAHLRSILNKLNCRNRQEVVARALREGMIGSTISEEKQTRNRTS